MIIKIFKYYLLLILALCFSVQPSKSQWTSDSSINTKISNFGINPLVVSDSYGGAIIAFVNLSRNRIYVQRINKYGHTVWNNNEPINVGGVLLNQTLIALESDHNGGAFILYYEDNKVSPFDTSSYLVYINKIDSSGLLKFNGNSGLKLDHELFNESNPKSYYDQLSEALVSDGNGGVFYAWTDSASGIQTVSSTIKLQRLDNNGNKLFGIDGITITPKSKPIDLFPKIVSDQMGGVLVFTPYKIFRVGLNGERIYGENGVTIQTGAQNIEVSSKLNRIISSSVYYDSINCSMYALNTGNILWSKYLVDSSNAKKIGAILDFNGNVYLNLLFINDQNQNIIKVSKINLAGEIVNTKNIVKQDSLIFNFTFVESNKDTNFILWTFRSSQFNKKIFISKISANLDVLWDTPKLVSTNETNEIALRIASDNNKGKIIVWFEVTSRTGIYCQLVNKNGQFGIVTNIENTQYEERIHRNKLLLVSSNYPNPFNSRTMIKYTVPYRSFVSLTVYDMLGREADKLVNAVQSPGTYQVTFDGAGHASGLYFYTLSSGGFNATKRMMLVK